MKQKNNWALVVSEVGDLETLDYANADPRLKRRLEVLSKKWESRWPDSEASIVTKEGSHIYMGRYYEGVVIRVNGNEDQVTYLTTEMAHRFAKLLLNPKAKKGDR